MSDHVFLTREGYEKLHEELEHLKTAKRREIAKTLAHARAMGDLRENAEYDAAKQQQAVNEKRIHELQEKLSRARIVEDLEIATDKAYLGAAVALKDLASGGDLVYVLVSQDEADASQGKISVTSPIAKALLGRGVGEEVAVNVPSGTLRYRILKISRP